MHALPLAPPRRLPLPAPSLAAVVGVVVLALAARSLSGWTAPFGFDETFSGVIASQPTAARMIDWCLNEIGGPVYYALLWCWAQVFGTSVAALRAPSLIFSVAAPMAVLRWGHPDHKVRLLWAALLALWLPAMEGATSARCYALLLLETTGQAILFRRLIDRPDRPLAFAWVGLSGLAVLTHYQSAILAGIQGLILLAIRPRESLRLWPALLLLVPVAGWMSIHLPLLARFATQGVWYPLLRWGDGLMAPATFFASPLIGFGAVLGLVLGIAEPRYRLRQVARPDVAVALSGIAALVLLVTLGMWRQSFAWRYTVMLGPAILLGMAAAVRQAGRSAALLPAVVVAVFASATAGRVTRQMTAPSDEVRYALNLQEPSEWLDAHGATRVGFLWDSPTGRISETSRIQEVIGFGPRQLGRPVAVRVIPQPIGIPSSAMVAQAVDHRQINGLIWFADGTVPGTVMMPDAAVLVRRRWHCHKFGVDHLSVLTCAAAPERARK